VHEITAFFLNLVDHFGYFGLYIVMTLANVGAPVGSELVLPAAGALAATGHLSSVWITVAVAVAGELSGQTIGYAVGRYGGRPFVERFGKYVHLGHPEIERAHGFFEKWGSFAVFICRFVPFIRGVVGVPAGIAEMPLVPFYLWTFLGSLIFCAGFILLGNSLGAQAQVVSEAFGRWAIVIAAVALVAAAVYFIVRSRVSRTSR